MQDGIHPQYREVVFRDEGADFQFITRSTIRTNQKITVDGTEYPLVYVDISAASHPFFTGKQRFVDSMGRIEKFNKKFGGSMLDRVKNLKKAKTGDQPS